MILDAIEMIKAKIRPNYAPKPAQLCSQGIFAEYISFEAGDKGIERHTSGARILIFQYE